jgi:small subunit ribosomal protein S16
MATRIRLRRVGRKGQPSYRIVVAEHTTARDGRFIATLGHYNPRPKDTELAVNAEQARYWLSRGAKPTDTVWSLLKKAGVFAVAPAPAAE